MLSSSWCIRNLLALLLHVVIDEVACRLLSVSMRLMPVVSRFPSRKSSLWVTLLFLGDHASGADAGTDTDSFGSPEDGARPAPVVLHYLSIPSHYPTLVRTYTCSLYISLSHLYFCYTSLFREYH